MKLSELQSEVGEWSRENFGEKKEFLERAEQFDDPDALMQLLGAEEELGELIHSVLKSFQGIREEEEGVGLEAERDAVADILIYLADFCERRGIDMEGCVEEVWEEEVSGRSWDSELRED